MLVQFRMLGNLEAEAGGRRLPLGGPCEQKVLAVLLLDANRVVPVTRLVDALWGDDPSATAVKQARNAVSRLRRLLAESGVPGAIETRGGGYRLAVGDDGLDARRFESMAAQAELAASAGHRAEAAGLLRSALDLWRGPFLAGMSGRVIEDAATAWDERRNSVSEAYYDHQLALGRHRETLGELSALVADHPLREKPAGQLMLALYGCGRQADALALYDKTRRLFADELGLDLGPALRRLHQQILTADPALAAAPEAGSEQRPAVSGTPYGVPRQLPAAVRHFAGRRDELTALTGLLDQAADPGGTVVISAMDGTAGIGKTTLAVHWAHQVAERFPDGQLYVNLRGFDPSGSPVPPAEAVRGFLDALQVAPERIPASLEAQAGLYRSLLAGRRMLIVLDNARDAGQVRPLLPGSRGALVLVTSRSRLTSLVAAEGACPLTLDLLTGAEARELLAGRLGQERIAAQPDAAGQLIGLCARLPLALSIAAARAAGQPRLPLAALVTELREARDRLDSLNAGDSATDMRAVFSWSYTNLSAPAARMFRLLGVHPGPDISTPAAASLAGIPVTQAREALLELTRAHLVTEHVPGRLDFHDLLRAYAAGRALAVDACAPRHAAIRRVLDHYLHTAHAAAMLLNPGRSTVDLAAPRPGVRPEDLASYGQALAWLDAEHRVLLGAITLAAEAGFGSYPRQIPWCLTDFFYRQGHWRDLAATQRTALTVARRTGDRGGEAYARFSLALGRFLLGDYDDAHTHLSQALDLYRRLGDRAGQAGTHFRFSWLFSCQGRDGEALDHAQQALELFRGTGDVPGQADAHNQVGWCHARVGDFPASLAHSERALSMQHEFGDRYGEAVALDNLGYARHHLGDFPAAIACYTRAIGLCRELGILLTEADSLTHLGDTHSATGDLEAARDAWQQALSTLRDLHHPDAAEVRAKLARLPAILAGMSPAAE